MKREGERERRNEIFIEFYLYNDSSHYFIILSDISLKKDKAVSEKSKDQDDQVVVRKWQTGAIVVSRLTEFSPENTPSKSRVRS